jgi:RsiW-degrading membrane proteinase PrsW (M82 family)
MIFIYSFIALFIAWIWVDYFRLIDIYEKESLKYFLFTFILGGASVLIVFALNDYLLNDFGFSMKGEFINDFLYTTFSIGAVEEFAKLIPFLILLLLFGNQVNEPIDYLAFICTSALGFSAVENVMYFMRHGSSIIDGRSILSTVGNMFDTALIAYGIILNKYRYNNQKPWLIVVFFFLASLSHGIYDFWLMYHKIPYGWLVTIAYFMVTISLFAVILNNSLNNSSFFTYKKVINSRKVLKRLIIYYVLVYLFQFLILLYSESSSYAVLNLSNSILFSGFIVFITIVRLSRFKLIKNRWQKLKFELPFGLRTSSDNPSLLFLLYIKGESFNEAYINKFYEEYFHLKPLSPVKTYLIKTHLAYIDKKLFLNRDQSYYVCKVYTEGRDGEFDKVLLKPKKRGATMRNEKHPIVAIYKVELKEVNAKKSRKLKFIEWAVVHSIKLDKQPEKANKRDDLHRYKK